MSGESVAIVTLAFFVAAFVKGTTGLGFSTSALPILALTIGIERALPLLIVPSLASNVVVMVQAGHFREMVVRFRWLYAMALPGIALGLTLLVLLDGRIAAAVLGAVLLAYSLFALLRPELSLPPGHAAPLAPVIGLATGTVNGLTGSQVMPLVPYLLALPLTPDRVVQASNVSFSVSSLAMAVGLTHVGLMTTGTALVSVLGILPMLAGLWLGARIRGLITPETFKRAVTLVLAGAGVLLILRPLLG